MKPEDVTEASFYNVMDDIEHLSKYYEQRYTVRGDKHLAKARIGLLATICGSLFGTLYTLWQVYSAGSYEGASVAFKSFDNIVEDSDKLSDEWRIISATNK